MAEYNPQTGTFASRGVKVSNFRSSVDQSPADRIKSPEPPKKPHTVFQIKAALEELMDKRKGY